MLFLNKTLKSILFLIIFLFLTTFSFAGESLLIFAGSASKPVLEEINRNFENENKVKVEVNFGGSGTILSQMKLAKKGDVYIPGSSDFMEKAKAEKLVLPETEERIAYLVPCICVPKDNPKNINSLEGLADKDLKIGIGVPQTVCAGLYAAEIMEASGLKEKIKPQIVTYAESCEKTASLIVMKNVDAVFGWDVFENWAPDKIKSVPIELKYLKRIGYIPAVVSKYSENKTLALKYIKYLKTPEVQSIIRKNGYITDEEELKRNYPGIEIGGIYSLPEGW